MRTMDAVALDNVSKRFGAHLAVDDLSLGSPGSVYGFIGPNGSGKTTTIRMIMNILLPDSGRIEVLGDARQRRRRATRRLPARGARPLQEDDGAPPAALLRAAQG